MKKKELVSQKQSQNSFETVLKEIEPGKQYILITDHDPQQVGKAVQDAIAAMPKYTNVIILHKNHSFLQTITLDQYEEFKKRLAEETK